MSKPKHTPGPWKSIDHLVYSGEQQVGQAAKSGGFPIVKIKEYRANARLIAAAPEMLEALQRAVSYGGSETMDWQDLRDLFVPLIAKAEGRDE